MQRGAGSRQSAALQRCIRGNVSWGADYMLKRVSWGSYGLALRVRAAVAPVERECYSAFTPEAVYVLEVWLVRPDKLRRMLFREDAPRARV